MTYQTRRAKLLRAQDELRRRNAEKPIYTKEDRIAEMRDPLPIRFARAVWRGRDCWEWQGWKDRHGYGRIQNAVKNEGKNFKIVWDAQMPDFDFWAIPKGPKNLDLSYKFLAFASDPKVMANQSKYIAYGPTHVDAIPHIAPDVLADLPTNPENMKTALTLDSRFWADHRDELQKRFNAWLAQ